MKIPYELAQHHIHISWPDLLAANVADFAKVALERHYGDCYASIEPLSVKELVVEMAKKEMALKEQEGYKNAPWVDNYLEIMVTGCFVRFTWVKPVNGNEKVTQKDKE